MATQITNVEDNVSVSSLYAEIMNEGTLPRKQSFEVGRFGADSGTQVTSYNNKLFGAPFQLLDSVDMRHPNINKDVGVEYLKHFLLHSPILHIRPGVPKYTGGTDPTSFSEGFRDIYYSQTGTSGIDLIDAAGTWMDKQMFGSGSKLQRRMYGLDPKYREYMTYVNYMCRSMAVFLGLTSSGKAITNDVPHGTFTNTNGNNPTWTDFGDLRWENYRMTSNSYVSDNKEFAASVVKTLLGSDKSADKDINNILEKEAARKGKITDIRNKTSAQKNNESGSTPPSSTDGMKPKDSETTTDTTEKGNANTQYSAKSFRENASGLFGNLWQAFDSGSLGEDSFGELSANQIKTVMFMVEPVSFSEQLTNNTAPSLIEQMVDSIADSVGSEIAFITNSGADAGMLGGLAQFLGSSMSSMAVNLSKLAEPVAGGFATNLFNGAINALSGQKMIYPEIYKSSNSTQDYEYSVTLTSPYGDIYNYYMNIIVPLCHLICLAAPRMLTSNSITSPFLVQAYVPGMATCNLGIISNMTISKNPDSKDVSVNGFPLTVKVTFQVKELYNAISISPTTNPASFMFNETLTDYMLNLAGLRPSIDTYYEAQKNAMDRISDYKSNDVLNDITSNGAQIIESLFGSGIRF
jgi:hypothetical protein